MKKAPIHPAMRLRLWDRPVALYYSFKTLNHGSILNVIHIGCFDKILNGSYLWIECMKKMEKEFLKYDKDGDF